jgi:predicted phosphoribosyltransferase
LSQRIFRDRREAGRLLAKELADFANRADVIVLALPRGGVPVGYEVARALSAPLDVFLVRKLGVPGYEELAMGATAKRARERYACFDRFGEEAQVYGLIAASGATASCQEQVINQLVELQRSG